ncbi:hypothetical protein OIU74_027421 [Salix koriyanagi]|uniref:Uncharacterized protein n=1 Tax=Salix koriyanagi TaxID=2511006 RepID=A0A9Q0VPG0_9ROSI|nr:hypothetical protein OIU74_027421 [Salix koriyanagi]
MGKEKHRGLMQAKNHDRKLASLVRNRTSKDEHGNSSNEQPKYVSRKPKSTLRSSIFLVKETGGTELASGLVAVALAHALALFSAVASSINISGGHVNPAVTFGSLVGGRISVFRAVFYWVAQLLGSTVAALLLRLVTNGMRPVGFHVQSGGGVMHGLLLEMALTFGLVYTV